MQIHYVFHSRRELNFLIFPRFTRTMFLLLDKKKQ